MVVITKERSDAICAMLKRVVIKERGESYYYRLIADRVRLIEAYSIEYNKRNPDGEGVAAFKKEFMEGFVGYKKSIISFEETVTEIALDIF